MSNEKTTTNKALIPMGLASKKLSQESIDGITRLLTLDHMNVPNQITGKPPADELVKWVRSCLAEKKSVAEKCIQRLLWHTTNGTLNAANSTGYWYLIGLLQFDASEKESTLSREQEAAILKLEFALGSLGKKSRGVSTFIRYGKGLSGTKLLYERLGEFAIARADRIDDICRIIKERDITSAKTIEQLLKSMDTPALSSGSL